jgi:hypothetical protein
LSTLPRTSGALLALALAVSLPGCDFSAEKEAAKRRGDAPKQTIDKVTSDVNKAMQNAGQGSDRLREDQK